MSPQYCFAASHVAPLQVRPVEPLDPLVPLDEPLEPLEEPPVPAGHRSAKDFAFWMSSQLLASRHDT